MSYLYLLGTVKDAMYTCVEISLWDPIFNHFLICVCKYFFIFIVYVRYNFWFFLRTIHVILHSNYHFYIVVSSHVQYFKFVLFLVILYIFSLSLKNNGYINGHGGFIVVFFGQHFLKDLWGWIFFTCLSVICIVFLGNFC